MTIHPQAIVETDAIGTNSEISAFVYIAKGAAVGENCKIASHVVIGKNTQLANDVTIGAHSTLYPDIQIGRGALIEAGTVVSRSVPPNAIVSGNPAQIIGYVNSASKKETKVRNGVTAPPLSTVRGVKLIDFPHFPDLRGDLCVGEFPKEVPFKPARFFLIYNVKSSEIRGEHAHKECEQFLICVKGSCAVVVDDGRLREEFELIAPSRGLYLPPMTWGIQYQYTPDAVLLVFASHLYDKDDYIRNYDQFLQTVSSASK